MSDQIIIAQRLLSSLSQRADVGAIFAALAPHGQIYFVGGVVRDSLLYGRISPDIDIATDIEPDHVVTHLEAAKIRTVPTGISHGTITAIIAGKPFEITTMRQDVVTDGRWAQVAYTKNITQDAQRRDFTINALYAGLDGHIIDPLGHGLNDIAARLLRFVGEPSARIKEDGLRLLRFARFVAQLGLTQFDEDAVAALSACRDQINGLSMERIWAEFQKILGAENPLPALTLLADSGLLANILGQDGALFGPRLKHLGRLVEIEQHRFLSIDKVGRLIALCPKNLGQVDSLAEKLRLPNKVAERLRAWAKADEDFVSYLSARNVRRLLYIYGPETYTDLLMEGWAKDDNPRREVQWRAMLAFAFGYQRPKLAIDGQMVMAAGANAGPQVGQILRLIEEWWIEADFTDDQLSQIERLKALVQALGGPQ